MASPLFSGTERLYGQTQTERLTQCHVVIVGLGGVGSWAAEALARTAVGRLTLIDLDEVCLSNTNRQLHATTPDVGRMKVTVMAERLASINPDCQIQAITDFLTADNLIQYLATKPDAVLDAIDSVAVKAALIHHCKRNKIPIVTTGGAGGRQDPLNIKVADLSQTTQDPLAARTRSLLRYRHHFSRNPKRRFGVECVYSTEQLRYPQPDGSTCQTKPNADTSLRLDCAAGLGASMMVTASVGMVAASRIVNKLLKKTQLFEADQ